MLERNYWKKIDKRILKRALEIKEEVGYRWFVFMCVCARSVTFHYKRPHGGWPPRLLCPWGYPSKNTGGGCYFFLQRIFLTQGSKLHLLYLLFWQVDSSPLSNLRSPNTNDCISHYSKVSGTAVFMRIESRAIILRSEWKKGVFIIKVHSVYPQRYRYSS